MNKLSYFIIFLCYLLLGLIYSNRKGVRIGNNYFNISKKNSIVLSSILYITLGYVYLADGVYDKFHNIEHNIGEILIQYIVIITITYIYADYQLKNYELSM